MSRRDRTIQAERWRVQVRDDQGLVTRESQFKTEALALDYFDALAPELGCRDFQHRMAGEQRFVTLRRKPKGAT